MNDPLRYGLLGPLEVVREERRQAPNASRLKTVLAMLLSRAGSAVSADELCEELWGDDLPPTAKNSLQVFIRDLRRLLSPGLSPRDPGQALRTSAAGYTLHVASGCLDVWRFEQLVAEGRKVLTQDPQLAGDRLREALGLWRGRALSDVPVGGVLHLYAAALEESRLMVLEQRVEADLQLERHGELVAELRTLTAVHPLREEFWRQLMLALYRSGRQADALAAYRRLRQTTIDELGVEPGADARRLHRVILEGASPATDRDETVFVTSRQSRTAVNQLPADIADFVGRDDALAQVEHALTGAARTAIPIVAISGRAGAGKTSLAVHAAHKLRATYPDGQLYVNLRGAHEASASSTEVLARFLRALGIEGDALPASADERAEMFRARLTGRRVLTVLDDAADEAQVRALLPSDPGCAVIITSRRRLPGLEGAVGVDLATFTPAEATTLLERLAGGDRVSRELHAAARIAQLCGMLPLAVRVAGGKLASKPHWSMSDLAETLADERSRLSQLRAGDLDVRASIELSYRACDGRQQRLFRLLGLLTVADFPAWLVAVLAATVQTDAEAVLEQLVDLQLLQVSGRDTAGQLRYQFHDLVRVFAVEQLARAHPQIERDAAMKRAFNAYRDLARHADASLQPGRLHPTLTADDAEGTEFIAAKTRALAATDPLAWFDAERLGINDATARAHAVGAWKQVWTLAHALHGYFDLRFHWDDWRQAVDLGLEAAHRSEDLYAEALMHHASGELLLYQGRLSEAVTCHKQATTALRELGQSLEAGHVELDLANALMSQGRVENALTHLDGYPDLFAKAGDVRGEAFARSHIGVVRRFQGRLSEAQQCDHAALRLFRQLGDRWMEAEQLRRVGSSLAMSGRLEAGAEALDASVTILRELGNIRGESMALRSLGEIRRMQGRLDAAEPCFTAARQIMTDLGDVRSEAYMAQSLGELYRVTERQSEARELLGHALAIFDEFDDERGQVLALMSLGNLDREEGRYLESIVLLKRTVTLARALSVLLWEARGLRDLGKSLAAAGDVAAALERWHSSLDLFRKAAAPETAEVTTLIETCRASR
ncbi:MAG: AfsR/SARP family transcriptional regulator [Stackebrandtia sp.]